MPGPIAKTDGEIQPFGGDIHPVVVGGQPEVDKRMAFAEVRQPWKQPAGGKGADGTHAQHFPEPAALEAVQHPGHPVEAVLQHRQQAFALLGDHQPPGQPFEQPDIELFLQLLDLIADCRLGHAQFDRRFGKAAVPRRGLESAEGIERQVRAIHAEARFY